MASLYTNLSIDRLTDKQMCIFWYIIKIAKKFKVDINELEIDDSFKLLLTSYKETFDDENRVNSTYRDCETQKAYDDIAIDYAYKAYNAEFEHNAAGLASLAADNAAKAILEDDNNVVKNAKFASYLIRLITRYDHAALAKGACVGLFHAFNCLLLLKK